MKAIQGNNMHTFRWMMGVVLTGACMGSTALTIGPVRQSVWLEQRLDIAVPIQLDAPAPADAWCASADVYFGDSLVDRAHVQVLPENAAAPEGARLRITTTTVVNEPVVTVELQVGCTPRVMRRFVLLPDIPVRPDAPAQPEPPTPSVATAPVAPAAITGAALPDTTGAARVATGTVQRAPAATVRPHPKPRLRLELRAPMPRTPPPAAASEGAHLTLEPLQAVGARAPAQEAPPLAASPEPAASAPSESERLQALQGDIQQLLKQAADSDAKLAALRERMERAESERATLATALGLLVATLAIATVAVALWIRRRRQALDADPELDPEAQDLVVDFNPVDSDHWSHAQKTGTTG